jgi:hypothetical protein
MAWKNSGAVFHGMENPAEAGQTVFHTVENPDVPMGWGTTSRLNGRGAWGILCGHEAF